jgi:hypothetical protein
VSHIDEQWQADLVDMQEYSKQNGGFKYILTVIDVLSKYLWAIPLKSKLASNVVIAFKKIFSDRIPLKIQTDRGLEFVNSQFKKLCSKYNIRYFTSQDAKLKCSVVERVNRTLKEKMFRYFTANGTRKYIDVLQFLVNSYNNRIHRSIKMTPAEVNESTEKIAYENLYGAEKLKNIYSKKMLNSSYLPIGSSVRKTYDLSSFDKGYHPNWSDQIYTVSKVLKKPHKYQYSIDDFKGEQLFRRFYPEELQKVSASSQYRIEKILKKRKRGKKIEFLVKWIGFPSSDNSWIQAKDLINLRKRR